MGIPQGYTARTRRGKPLAVTISMALTFS